MVNNWGVLKWKNPKKKLSKTYTSIDLKTEYAIWEISDRLKPQIPAHTIDQYAQLQLLMSQTDLSTS